jgi:hypothetical protein
MRRLRRPLFSHHQTVHHPPILTVPRPRRNELNAYVPVGCQHAPSVRSTPFGLHECRHAYVSFMRGRRECKDAERVLGTGRYRDESTATAPVPGDESEAAGLLDAYLERVSPTGAIVRVGND